MVPDEKRGLVLDASGRTEKIQARSVPFKVRRRMMGSGESLLGVRAADTHCCVVDLERADVPAVALVRVVHLDLERALQLYEHDLVVRDLGQPRGQLWV